jgi:hypothetical protein
VIDRGTRRHRRAGALVGAGSMLVGAGFGLVPVASAATPSPSPTVQSVSLQSSATKVTSSTSHQLLVQLNATQGQTATITLRDGSSATSESHAWTFPIDSSALTVDSNGRGTLNIPAAEISPYGTVDLTIQPVGKPTTQSCQGAPTSQTQQVSLGGSFFFDTHSSGSHAWGTVGKKTGKFTFSATNTVVWTYVNTNPGCYNLNSVPCQASLYWQSPNQALILGGSRIGTKGSIFASRTTSLSAPSGASRADEAFGVSKKLALVRSGSAASLKVTALTNSTGSATLSAKRHSKPASQHCAQGGKTKTETLTSWNNARYRNGTKPLKVLEQIFGAIKVPNNSQATISKASVF